MTAGPHADEATLLHEGSCSGRFYQVLANGALGVLVIASSVSTMTTNKTLMDGGFPYAEALVLLHAIFTVVVSSVLLLMFPSLFPSLTDPIKRIDLHWDFLLKGVGPMATFLTALLVINDVIYQYASLAFVQMVKGGGVVLVYTLLVLCGMELFKARNALVLLFIMGATALTIEGELSFSPTGLLLLLISLVIGACSVVLQGRLLAGNGPKLDGFTFILLVYVQQCVILGAVVVIGCTLKLPFVRVPSLDEVLAVRWLLLANMLAGFLNSTSIAIFIKYSSPLAYVLTETVKDAAVVLGSAVFLADPLTPLQAVAFPIQLALILLWSLMKTFPEAFAEGGQFAFIFPARLRDPPQRPVVGAGSGSKAV